jgi:hypothetical protein
VDFALKKDSSEAPPKWYVFFKTKNADALQAAFSEYTKANYVGKKEKPSLLEAYRQIRRTGWGERAAAAAPNSIKGQDERR